MSTLTLKQVGDLALEVQTDHWTVRIDAPLDKGGTQTGPTPTELTAIALAACKAMTVLKWSNTKGLPVKDITAEVRYEMAEIPRRISEMDVVLKDVKKQIPAELHQRLEAAIDACIVANTLKHPPQMSHRVE